MNTNLFGEKVKVFTGHTTNDLPSGWRWRNTEGHGYLVPSEKANLNVPEAIRQKEYEEDCAYSIPICFNKSLFSSDAINNAEKSFADWLPNEFEKYIRKLKEGESYLNDKYSELVKAAGNYERGAGFGDWCFDVPEGMVYRIVRKVELNVIKRGLVIQDFTEERSMLLTPELDSKYYFTPEEVEKYAYKRDESFYTWEAYTEKTGKERYK